MKKTTLSIVAGTAVLAASFLLADTVRPEARAHPDLPHIELRAGDRSAGGLPTVHGLDRLFRACYEREIPARVALERLEVAGIKPVKTDKVRGGKLTVALYRTSDRGDLFFAVYDEKGAVWRWGIYW